MDRIVVFGGTFNPVHNGHMYLAQQFENLLKAQRVLLIPTFVPPHKRVPDLASAKDRLAMCRLACAETTYEASDLEIRRGGASYTSDTLLELKRENPDAEIYFITGEDMFLTLDRWHESEQIYSLATICAAPRSEDGLERLQAYADRLKKRGAKVILQNIDYLPISSTMVRHAVQQGRDISALVPSGVAQYIEENGLYRNETDDTEEKKEAVK